MEKPKPKRPKTGGRQKGTPNKLHGDLRTYVLEAAKALEDAGKGLDVWAMENPNLFWTHMFKGVMPKPVEISGPGGNAIPILHRHEIVYVKPRKTDAPDE